MLTAALDLMSEHRCHCRETVLLPCRHMTTCSQCSDLLRSQRSGLCPLCREPIQDVIKVFR